MYSAKSHMHSVTHLLSVTICKRDTVYTLQAKWTLPKKIVNHLAVHLSSVETQYTAKIRTQTNRADGTVVTWQMTCRVHAIGKIECFVSCKHSANRMNMWKSQGRLLLLVLVVGCVVALLWSSRTFLQGYAVAMDLTGQGHHLLLYPPNRARQGWWIIRHYAPWRPRPKPDYVALVHKHNVDTFYVLTRRSEVFSKIQLGIISL